MALEKPLPWIVLSVNVPATTYLLRNPSYLLATLCLALHLAFNRGYGPFRDELYFMVFGLRPDFGIGSLRHDPQGKAMAQVLLDMPIAVPAAWLENGGALAAWTERVAS